MPVTLGEVEATRVAGLICKLISVWPWSGEATVGAPSSPREPLCCGPASPSRGTCWYGSGEGLAGRGSSGEESNPAFCGRVPASSASAWFVTFCRLSLNDEQRSWV